MDLTECSLCQHQYDDCKRRARTLPCAHFYCQTCLDQIIKSSNSRCPTCRRDISTNSADSLPPNFLMDDLINKFKTGSVLVDSKEQGGDSDAGECPKHRKCQLYFTCKSHKVKICRDCTVLDHQPSQCQIISFEDELKETKDMTVSDLKTQKKNREQNITDLQNIIADTRAEVGKQKDEIVTLQSKINENEQLIENANIGINDCLANKSKIEKIQQELTSSRTMNQINHSCQEAQLTIKESNSVGKSIESNFQLTSLQELIDQRPDQFVSKVLHGGTLIHATAEVNGEKRFAQLMVKNGDILLPALASCNQPPASNITVTVSSILTHYTDADIYMTLASEGKELGTIYIKPRNNDFAKYIRKLCIGTIGPTYRGAIFKGKNEYTFWVGKATEYDSSTCSEDTPILPVTAKIQKGTLYIPGTTFNLAFWMYDEWKSDVTHAVGDVIHDINVLEYAHKCPAGKLSIKDVGIVLK